MTHDVFVSHSSSDAPVAVAIVNALEASGIRCWIAPRDIQGGQIWAEAIMRGIEGARAMVVVFSANANRSTHVLTEVDTAVRRGCIVVPFRIEAVDPEGALAYHLRTRHWLDALTPEMATHIRQLVDTMARLLEVTPEPKPVESQPWLRTVPPVPPPPRPTPPEPTPSPVPRLRATLASLRRRPALLGLAIVAVMIVGALLLWVDQRRGRFVVRDASVASEPVALPVRVTGVRFFEAGGQVPASDQRNHDRRFAAGSSRYIYVQLDLVHDRPPREVRVPISCTITNQDGAVLTTITATGRIEADWTGSNWASGWGNESGGTWQAGTFTAECSYAGATIATGRFEVWSGGGPPAAPPAPAAAERLDPRLPELGGRVSAIRFFPDYAGPITPRGERRYTTSFSARDMLYLGIELELDHPAPGRRVALKAACEVNRADGSRFGEVTLAIDTEAEWTGSYSAASYGWPEAGRWPTGSYRVSCRISGRLVARGSVTVR